MKNESNSIEEILRKALITSLILLVFVSVLLLYTWHQLTLQQQMISNMVPIDQCKDIALQAILRNG